MKLLGHNYGKARVRVMKIFRRGRRHSLKELEVSIMLQGDFDASYTEGDNRLVVATDTMKNTINVLAHRLLTEETEPFGVAITKHFLETYSHIRQVEVRLDERRWDRIRVAGRPHRHSFVENGSGQVFAQITATREKTIVESGIEGLLILKTTESGFENFLKDEFTTLRETSDRILATRMNAIWTYRRKPSSHAAARERIIDAMLAIFATRPSPSAQATLFEMGEAALRAVPEVETISLTLPNQHCLPIDLKPFGIENRNELFVPTEEPHGQIEATIGR